MNTKQIDYCIELARTLNFSAKYKDSISISLLVRQAVHFLPEAMRLFAQSHPDVQIVPLFQYDKGVETFLREEADVLFTLKELTRQIPGINVHDLYTSHIYLIAQTDDPLAEKNLIREEDLYGRTLMVGGGSPDTLRAVQHRLISSGRIDYFNSADHDTTLTNVAAGKGVCLAPGFLNDHSGQFLPGFPLTARKTSPVSSVRTRTIRGKALTLSLPS